MKRKTWFLTAIAVTVALGTISDSYASSFKSVSNQLQSYSISTISADEKVSFVSGHDNFTSTQSNSAQNEAMKKTWVNDFQSDASLLSNATLHLDGTIQKIAQDTFAKINGTLKIGSNIYKVTGNNGWVTSYNTSVGTINQVTVQGTIDTKDSIRKIMLLILFQPGSGQYEVTMSIHDQNKPVYLAFGKNILNKAVLGVMKNKKLASLKTNKAHVLNYQNKPLVASPIITTSTAYVAPSTSSSDWNYVSNGSTNNVNGANAGGPACVVLASDQMQGDSKVIRDQIWGGTQAERYLQSTFGVPSSDVWIGEVHYAVSVPNQNFQLGGIYPGVSDSGPLSAWTWSINYVPWNLGTVLNAIADSNLTWSGIGQDTSPSLYFEQYHLNGPNYDALTDTSTPASNFMSYAERFGTNTSGSQAVQVDGLIVYYVRGADRVFACDSNWVYAGGTM